MQFIADTTLVTYIILSVGDFNLPNLHWHQDDDTNGFIPSNASSEHEHTLVETVFAAGLHQVNTATNYNGRLLDLAFISQPENVDLILPPLPLLPIDNHHPPFILLLDKSCVMLPPLDNCADNSSFNFHLCDFRLLNNILSDIDWNILLGNGTLDDKIALFYEVLHNTIANNVPKKRASNTVFNQPWWTLDLRNLRNKLRKLRKRFFHTKSDTDSEILRDAETSYKVLLAATYDNYVSRIQASVKQDPSLFWKFIKRQKSSNRIPQNVNYDGTNASTNTEAAELFASFFENVYSNASPVQRNNCFTHIPTCDINLPLIRFSENDVLTALEELDSKKGAGSDGIHPLFLKGCAVPLASPIAHIFNCSLQERIFPAAWKSAFIVPIHKSGNSIHVSNYRGVSILCSLSKVFEKLIHNLLYNTVSSIISESQHGFMRNRSTTTNLMCYVNSLSREVEARRQVDSVYIDFAKAFDTVPHNLVVDKMRHMGFPQWFTEWIYSYLTERNAFVVVNLARSRTFNITSGVPQGSVLGPLIFNIFVNDLSILLSSFKLSFADDLKFFRIISTPLDCAALQEDINMLLIWCDNNGMRVNNKKCKVISFTRCSNSIQFLYSLEMDPLDRVQSICDLGVTIDSKLRFNEHIGIITAKAFSTLGFIRRHASDFTDIYALKTLYCSLVRSILEYAAPVWCPYHVTQIIGIERVQRKFIRFALRALPWNDPVNLPHYPERCQLIRLESLSARRINQQRLFVFDLIQGNTDCPSLLQQIQLYVPPRRFRNSPLLAIPYHRTDYGFNNPFDSCLRVFNEVGQEFDFTISKGTFTNRIRALP